MVQSRKLAAAIKQAVIGTASAAAILTTTGYTHAQSENSVSLEEITVTGSRIKRADLDSPNPVTVINRDEIKVTGLTDVGDFVQSMPSMSGSPIGTTTNNGGNGNVRINLRGLGVDRTLTLVNGRRVVDRGDYQSIPSAMIEQVEILKNGASAVYGADAVAGVVNIITRKDYEGVELEVQTTDFFDMDSGQQDNLSLVAGKTFDGGHIVVGAEYVDQEEAYQADTPWDFMQNSYFIYPASAAGCESSPQNGCYPVGSSRIPEARLSFATQGNFMNEGNGLVPLDGRTYNYAPVNFIQTPYERTNLFLEGSFDVAENVKAFAEVRANLRSSAQELAPVPYDSRFDPAYSGFYTDDAGDTVAYNGISPDNFYLVQAATAAGLTPEPVTEVRRRMLEAPRSFTQDITQVNAVLGFEGTLNDMDWQFTYTRGYRSRTDQDFGQYVGLQLAQAMGPSADLDGDGSPECYEDINDPGTLIAGCVPINFFGGPGAVTQEMLDFVGADLTDHITTELETLDFNISGEGFELPGGALGWAVGLGYIGEQFDNSPDSGKQTGAVTGNKGAGTQGSLYSTSIYGEIYAPLLEVGSQTLDLTFGARMDDYNQFDSETTWQLGVEYNIYDDLKLRASTGTVFRAPLIEDLFGGLVDSFDTYTDPCASATPAAFCDRQGVQSDTQVLGREGGNPNLTPETGDTFSAGLVFTPTIGEGDLSITLDYWKTEIEDGISSLGVQFILEDCYENGNSQACDLVTRRASDYSVSQILNSDLNVAEQTAEGVDTEIRYILDTDLGQFRASFLWSHLLERSKVPFPGGEEDDLTGRYTDPTAEDGGAYAEDKFNYTIAWLKDSMSVSYRGEYIGSLEADVSFVDYIQKVDSVLYHDLTATYTLPFGTSIGAGITNLTDEEPPFIDIGFNASTDPSTYRLFGRGYYLRLTHEF